EQRARMEYPWLPDGWQVDPETGTVSVPQPELPPPAVGAYPTEPAPFLLEIGTEELPAADLDAAIAQLEQSVPALLDEARLAYESIRVTGTPRRLVVLVDGLAPSQRAEEIVRRGPPVKAAYDARSEEHMSELQSREKLVCRLLLENKKCLERLVFSIID